MQQENPSRLSPDEVQRNRKVLAVLACIAVLGLGIYPSLFFAPVFLRNPFPPSLSDQEAVERMVRRHVTDVWRGEIIVESIEVRRVEFGSDFPINYTWTDYAYVVHMKDLRYDQTFIGVVSRNMHYEDLSELFPFSQPLDRISPDYLSNPWGFGLDLDPGSRIN